MTHRVQQIRPDAPKTRIAKGPKILCISRSQLSKALRPATGCAN
jgi:hypothetical protein